MDSLGVMLHQCKRGTSCSPSWEEWGILEQGSSRLQAVQRNKVTRELIITAVIWAVTKIISFFRKESDSKTLLGIKSSQRGDGFVVTEINLTLKALYQDRRKRSASGLTRKPDGMPLGGGLE